MARPHDRPIPAEAHEPIVHIQGDRVEMLATPDAPPMRMRLRASCAMPFVALSQSSAPLLYRTERARGYDHAEIQHSPGYFECTLRAGRGPGARRDDGGLVGAGAGSPQAFGWSASASGGC